MRMGTGQIEEELVERGLSEELGAAEGLQVVELVRDKRGTVSTSLW
jgi:hypothetical protein